jgi:tetratricopeptide (TPR) repeat protein
MKGGENPEEVISCLKKSVSLSPNFAMARENLAIMLVNYRQYENSLKESEALLLESPDNIRMLHHQGVALYHLNRLPQATDAFLKAVRVSPHFRDSNVSRKSI